MPTRRRLGALTSPSASGAGDVPVARRMRGQREDVPAPPVGFSIRMPTRRRLGALTSPSASGEGDVPVARRMRGQREDVPTPRWLFHSHADETSALPGDVPVARRMRGQREDVPTPHVSFSIHMPTRRRRSRVTSPSPGECADNEKKPRLPTLAFPFTCRRGRRRSQVWPQP
jgi:hypothetical protein